VRTVDELTDVAVGGGELVGDGDEPVEGKCGIR
jgi:hypothetical protein